MLILRCIDLLIQFVFIEFESSSPRLEMILKCRDLWKREERAEFDSQIAQILAKMSVETFSIQTIKQHE